MDFWKTMGVLLRRWYVSVPIFVVSLVLGGGVFLVVPTTYESTGTIVLTAPPAGAVTQLNPANATGPGNPLLDFEGSLTITTQLLIQSLSSPTVQNEIAAQGGSSTYQAGDGNTGGPFVVIIADAKSKTLAERTVTLALQYASNELNQRQKALQAPPSTFINTQVVVEATPATTKLSNKLKGGGVALALGLVLSLATAFAVDSAGANRKRRKAEQPTPDKTAATAADVDSDESDEERTAVTPAVRPAPRPVAAPVRSNGQRPGPHPQVASAMNGRPPMHKPHPAKPRMPAPIPGGTNHNNGNGNGTHDWPRTEYRSPDTTAG
jgi:hypothetical protein